MKNGVYVILLAALLVFLCLCLSSPQLVAFAQEAYEPLPTNCPAPYQPSEDGYTADGMSYSDASITVTSRMERAYDTDLLVIDVIIQDPTQLRTMLAGSYGSKATKTVARMCKSANAVIGFNGDWFDMYGDGVVIRNGRTYRASSINQDRDILVIDTAGDFHLLVKPTRSAYNALLEACEPMHAFSFGPALIVDGEPMGDFPHHSCGIDVKRGRLAFAQIDTLHYCIVAAEDSAQYSGDDDAGLTIPELVAYLASLGNIQQAYNLDGGNTVYVDIGGQRASSTYSRNTRMISDIVYFATLVPDGEVADK